MGQVKQKDKMLGTPVMYYVNDPDDIKEDKYLLGIEAAFFSIVGDDENVIYIMRVHSLKNEETEAEYKLDKPILTQVVIPVTNGRTKEKFAYDQIVSDKLIEYCLKFLSDVMSEEGKLDEIKELIIKDKLLSEDLIS